MHITYNIYICATYFSHLHLDSPITFAFSFCIIGSIKKTWWRRFCLCSSTPWKKKYYNRKHSSSHSQDIIIRSENTSDPERVCSFYAFNKENGVNFQAMFECCQWGNGYFFCALFCCVMFHLWREDLGVCRTL